QCGSDAGTVLSALTIEGVGHNFSTLPNVREDMIEFLLNIKDIRIRTLVDRPGKMFLEASGEGPVTAAQIQTTADFEIVNPEQYLATLETTDARLFVEFTVAQGRGYVPAGSRDGLAIGVIAVDAI